MVEYSVLFFLSSGYITLPIFRMKSFTRILVVLKIWGKIPHSCFLEAVGGDGGGEGGGECWHQTE